MADALLGSMDAAEYKHAVLGLIFLKHISDAFEEAHAKLKDEHGKGVDPEYPNEYRAQNIFTVSGGSAGLGVSAGEFSSRNRAGLCGIKVIP